MLLSGDLSWGCVLGLVDDGVIFLASETHTVLRPFSALVSGSALVGLFSKEA